MGLGMYSHTQVKSTYPTPLTRQGCPWLLQSMCVVLALSHSVRKSEPARKTELPWCWCSVGRWGWPGIGIERKSTDVGPTGTTHGLRTRMYCRASSPPSWATKRRKPMRATELPWLILFLFFRGIEDGTPLSTSPLLFLSDTLWCCEHSNFVSIIGGWRARLSKPFSQRANSKVGIPHANNKKEHPMQTQTNTDTVGHKDTKANTHKHKTPTPHPLVSPSNHA